MAVDFSNESPLAVQLHSLVQPKLAEYGWTTTGDDTTLFEYILLMLANDKNESQVAAELANDLLDLPPENTETQQFAQWLFEQIEILKQQQQPAGPGEAQVAQTVEGQVATIEGEASAGDMDMDGDDAQGTIPTGPKAMRNSNGNGSGAQPARLARGGRNMLSQMNKNMNRQDDSALHRVRGAGGGVGRINSHARDPPKGPRGQNIGRGIEAMATGRGMANANMSMGGMNGMPMVSPNGQPMPGMLNPQQQMALMQMYEQQAQMMQQIFSGGNPTTYLNPHFNGNQRNGSKKPLHQRMDRPQGSRGLNPGAKAFAKKEDQDETMGEGSPADYGEGMEVERTRPEPAAIMCKFNLRCTNPDCAFVHQSPAAMPGTPVDMNDKCDYGAACKNRKCVGKHPSPAQRQKFQSEQECAFWPNCRDPSSCPYKHPSKAACRNGADCTAEGCTFGHSTVQCKFNPCLNLRCPYKHAPGQKKNTTNVWVAPKVGEHVSERKFVDEDQPEELIIPGQDQDENQQQVQAGEGAAVDA